MTELSKRHVWKTRLDIHMSSRVLPSWNLAAPVKDQLMVDVIANKPDAVPLSELDGTGHEAVVVRQTRGVVWAVQ